MDIDFTLSKEQIRIKNLARDLASQFEKRAENHDRDRSAPIENFDLLCDSDLLTISIPKKLGGYGGGLLGWTIACEELVKGCASTALAFNMHVNSIGFICESEDIPDIAKLSIVEKVLNNKDMFCYAVSEPNTSSLIIDTCVPKLKARKVSGGYILNGTKAFISNWESADYAYLYAHVENDPNVNSAIGLMVPTRSNNIFVTDWWDVLGMRATRSQKVEFNGTFISNDNILHHTDDFIQFFVGGGPAWSFGAYTAVYLGVGLAILEEVKRLVTKRIPKGFNQCMGYHPDIRRNFSEMVCLMSSARSAMYEAAYCHDTKVDSDKLLKKLLRAKLMVGNNVAKTAHLAVNTCGLHGLFKGEKLERLFRDAMTASIMPPNSDACAGTLALLELGLNPSLAVEPLQYKDNLNENLAYN